MADTATILNPADIINQRLLSKWQPNVRADAPQNGGFPSGGFLSFIIKGHVYGLEVVKSSTIQFDEARLTEIPAKAIIVTKSIRNCADTTLNSTLGISIQAMKGWRVTKTRTVSTNTSLKAGGSLNMKLGGVGVGLTTDVSWSETLTNSESNEQSASTQTTIALNDAISLKPFTAIQVQAMVFQVAAIVPFRFTATFDGEVFPEPGWGNFADRWNHHGVSELLTEEERTFEVAGELHIFDTTAASVTTTPLSCATAEDKINTKERVEVHAAALHTGFAKKFQPLSDAIHQLNNDGGAAIGNTDGTRYEVLYTETFVRPAVECGLNDIGLPNPGNFLVEHRQYTTWEDGKVVSSKVAPSDPIFQSCVSV